MAVTIDGTNGVSGPINVTTDSVKLDGNYPVGTNNVALGDTALDALTTGSSNVGIGHAALTANTTGADNTAVGYQALWSSTTASYNNAFGHNALVFNTTGANNVAVGNSALQSNTTASNNTAVGHQALIANTTGTQNVAVGQNTTDALTTGSSNVAVGAHALGQTTTASNNTAVGKDALTANITGIGNTAIGYNAGSASNYPSLTNVYNTFVGGNAGSAITTGARNVILGSYTGNQNGLDIRTSDGNIVLSDGNGYPALIYDATSGYGTFDVKAGHLSGGNWAQVLRNVSGSNNYGMYILYGGSPNNAGNEFIYAADSTEVKFYVSANGNVNSRTNSYGGISDIKLKENITEASSQWDDIKAVKVKNYSFIAENSDAPTQLGVIAQDLESAGMSGLVVESEDKDGEGKLTGTTTKTVKYSVLYMKAVKALQEAMERIETLEAKVQALESN